MKTPALLLTLTLLAACSTAGAGDVCGPWRPIIPDKAGDRGMSVETARQIGAHNETGARLCQWGPRQ